MKLIIGNRNYSSWSLRAWLYIVESDLSFEEIRIPMFTDTWREAVAKFGPAGRVPVLIDDAITVWDSTAIIQYLGERYTQAVGWPKSARARAHAQSIAAEMHSGFMAIRGELPQNIRRHSAISRNQLTDDCNAQIDRVIDIWNDCRKLSANDGPWLFGDFSIADVMFVPVALRFQSYGIEIDGRASDFMDAVLNLDSVKEWSSNAASEPERIDFIDNLVPAAESPLTLG